MATNPFRAPLLFSLFLLHFCSISDGEAERLVVSLPQVADDSTAASLSAAGGLRLDWGLEDGPPEWRRVWVFETPARLLPSVLRQARMEPDPEFRLLISHEPMPVPWLGGRTDSAGPQFPNDPDFEAGMQWGLEQRNDAPFGGAPGIDVRVALAWERFKGSTGTRLGLVDTGIDENHPDLGLRLADRSPRLVTASVFPGGDVADSLGHGTLVCGVMAALTNNGPVLGGRGVAGVAGGEGGDSAGSRVISIKVTAGHRNVVRGTDLARALVLAGERGAEAINVSLAGDASSDAVRAALRWLAARGTAVICGAGNTADDREQFPAAYSKLGLAVSVGAISADGELASFSTYGDAVDVVAPGVDILSTFPTYENASASPLRDFALASGTSFAAPFVTGIAGLAYGLEPDLSANDFQVVLRETARDWGPAGRDPFFGSGLADAASLILALSPPRRVLHGETSAAECVPAGEETLRIRKSAFWRGDDLDGDYLAQRYRVRARVELPDSVTECRLAWMRPVGPAGWKEDQVHDGDDPWGEAAVIGRALEVETFVYRVNSPPAKCPTCPPIGWLPRAPEAVRMAWSAWVTVAPLDSPPIQARLRLERPWPNPARGRIRFRFSGGNLEEGARLTILDTEGRVIAERAGIAGAVVLEWDGIDRSGRIAPAGLYLARLRRGAEPRVARFVWLP